ncbi:MAG: gamma-glutamylcyclotransferase [Sulfitobacter sp.]|nr:gamma-glutamylcyclotransferase [Sulfitobacter sp.]
MTSDDPFRHHPELRDMIKPAAASFFREMDLDEVDRRAAENGRPADWRTPCSVREEERLSYLKSHGSGDLWVFGYGSLMWDPALEFTEVRHARVEGFERSFCLWDEGGRGTPARPGLMLALDEGGGCEGLAFRIAEPQIEEETFVLFRREMIARAYEPHWVDLQTAHGALKALTFVANHENERIKPGIPLPQQAEMIAHAEGHLGTNQAYLDQTHGGLAFLGIEDPYISDLYRRVRALKS